MIERYRDWQARKKTADAFVKSITEKEDISLEAIDPQDAYSFAYELAKYHPPKGFFQRLASGMYFLDQERFTRGLQNMASAVLQEVKNNPYYMIMPERDGSNDWIYQQMLSLGLSPAEKIIYTSDDQVLENDIPQSTKLCIVDDFAPTGSQITTYCLDANSVRKRGTHIFLLTATNYAKERIKKADNSTILKTFDTNILSLPEFMTPQDIAFLEKTELSLLKKPLDSISFSENKALFWSWYKVPDCVHPLFLGEIGLPPLIRPERFEEPY